MAQGIFETLVTKEGLEEKILTDSAGTGAWHVGELPDSRMRATAMKKGIVLNSRARQFTLGDFRRFDLILAMDQSNMETLESLCPENLAREKLKLFRSFDPDNTGGLDVPDPYFGVKNGFEVVFQMVNRTCPKILEYLQTRFSLT